MPTAGALVVAFLPRARKDLTKLVAVIFSTTTCALSLWLLSDFEYENHSDMFQFVSRQSWISDFGISWSFGVDGISLFLIVLTGILFPIAFLAVDPEHNDRSYFAWMLLLEAGVMGVFCSLDLILFFLCFEVVLVPMYFLISRWGHGNRSYAATKFFLFTMAGSALMLVGIITVAFLHADNVGGSVTFDLVEIAESQSIAQGTARWLFLTFALAFAVKIPIFPLHLSLIHI